jgi:hypothetical protein
MPTIKSESSKDMYLFESVEIYIYIQRAAYLEDRSQSKPRSQFLWIVTMQVLTASMLAATLALAVVAAPAPVYTNYPYTGPAVPIGDWVDRPLAY